jgi:hypothetical protein
MTNRDELLCELTQIRTNRTPLEGKVTVDDVRAALDRAAACGSQAGIAEFFRDRRILAVPGRCHSCVIARYLRHELPGLEYVKVSPDEIDMDRGTVQAHTRSDSDPEYEDWAVLPLWTLPLPAVLNEFAIDFDDSAYPFLVDPDPRWG